MDENDIQEVADEMKLDVREMQSYHLRLLNRWGKPIVDVYIKRKKGRIVQNTVMNWKKNRWTTAKNQQELKNIINN